MPVGYLRVGVVLDSVFLSVLLGLIRKERLREIRGERTNG